MLKKNIAKAMAAATVFTAVAPVTQSFAAVIDSNQEQEIKDLKEKVYEKFNTKYTKNEALKNKHNGEGIYSIKIGNGAPIDNYADFETEFDKKFAELKNGENLTVSYTSTPFRVLEDEKTIVDFKESKFTGITKTTGIAETDFTRALGGIVFGELEDNTAYAKIPVSNGYITVKNDDVRIDLNKPIFKVVEGNYVNEDGVAIKKFDEKSVVADAKTVFEKGGVIEGYYLAVGADEDTVDSGTYAIVKRATAVTKENVLTSDLYEVSADRLTKKGNELRKVIADTTNKANTGAINERTKLVVDIYGLNKAGEKVAVNSSTAEEIKIIFEERANSISEWTPVYEITITDVRGNELSNVVNHVINNVEVRKGMNLAAGLDRYQTSVELSKKGWADNSLAGGTVVLVSGANDKLVDGLTATPLATSLNDGKGSPVLLTKKDSIPQEVIDEITRLGAKNVYIVGGDSAVSTEVEELLAKTYNKNVTRLSGNSRYETSILVAEEIAKLDADHKFDEVFVVGGKGEVDALSVSAVAGAKKSPILLTAADKLDKNVEAFLKSYVSDTAKELDAFNQPTNIDSTDIFVVGGENSVSKKVQSEIATIAGTDFEIERLAGEGRQETNAKVIERFAFDKALQKPRQEIDVVVGKSNNAALVDALSAGAYAAKEGAHIVLATNELTETQEDVLSKISTWNKSLPVGSVVKKKVQAGYGIAEKVAKFIKGL